MSTALPRPPAITQSRRWYAISAVAFAIGGLCVWVFPTVAMLTASVFLGLFCLHFARIIGRDAWGTAYVAAALQSLTRGRYDEVENFLARVPSSSLRRGTVARSVAVQRALLALFRGSADGAIAAVEPALAPEVRLYTRSYERLQQASAHGVRALAHAMKGDAARAEADAAAAEAIGEALPEALARSRLARAMIVARSGDMVALASVLAKDGSLILEHTMPRERALVRALRKMAHGRDRSVYREPSKPTDGNEPGAIAGWIAQVAPDAAAYASDDVVLAETSEVAEPPIVSKAALKAVAASRSAAAATTPASSEESRRSPWKTGVLWLVFFGMLYGVANLASTMHVPHPAGVTGAAESAWFSFDYAALVLVIVVAVAIVGMHIRQIRQMARSNLALIGSYRASALGDAAAADALARSARRASMASFRSAADASMASIAERRADFGGCLNECDVGIARLGKNALAEGGDETVLPALLGLRGVALAALGRHGEAEAELALLVDKYPSYPHLPLYDFRIRLINALRQGDLQRARTIAMTRTAELPIPLRDDLLADLVIATGPRGLSEEERKRLDAELREVGEAATWIDAVAPGLRDHESLHGRRVRFRVQGAAPHPQTHIGDGAEVDEIPIDPFQGGAAIKRVEANG